MSLISNRPPDPYLTGKDHPLYGGSASLADAAVQDSSSRTDQGNENQNVVTSQDPGFLNTQSILSQRRIEGALTSLQKMAPDLNLEHIVFEKHVTKLHGGKGVYNISYGNSDVIIKPKDNNRTTPTKFQLSTNILKNLGIATPNFILINNPEEVDRLNKILSEKEAVYIAMEKIDGTSLSMLSTSEAEKFFSKKEKYFKQIGKLFIFDHLLNENPDRVTTTASNIDNMMLRRNEIVAIDNSADFFNIGGERTTRLNELLTEGALRTVFRRHQERSVPFIGSHTADMDSDTSTGPSRLKIDPALEQQFIKGVANGIKMLLKKFTRAAETGPEVDLDKVTQFLRECECPKDQLASAATLFAERMNVIIGLSTIDEFRGMRPNPGQNRCEIL